MLLPYNRNNPIVYDNDGSSDVYTDELLMALSSAGEINLRGIISTSPSSTCCIADTIRMDTAGRSEIAKKARRSGLKNIPCPVFGPCRALNKPESGCIEDTESLDTPGSRLIIEEAKKTTPDNPLVVIMGGPLTVAADAYLLDNSIADRIIIAWLGGSMSDMNDYNGWVDPWADYIVLRKLKMVQFPGSYAEPHVPKERLIELPDCELRQWMIDKQLPHVNLPGDKDGDGQPVISVLNPDYVIEAKTVSFDRWIETCGEKLVPAFKNDISGNVMVVTCANKDIATDEWWKAMKNLKAWDDANRALPKARRPFFAIPFPIGAIERIEAEDFDHGGDEIAYNKKCKNGINEFYRSSYLKIEEADDIPGGYNIGAGGGHCLTGMEAGDWVGYTINIEKAGIYRIGIRVASEGSGGMFHIEFDGVDKTGPITIPDTGGWFSWQTVLSGNVRLNQGEQVMRLVIDKNGVNDLLGNINYFEISYQTDWGNGK